jgi:hypothetical protein
MAGVAGTRRIRPTGASSGRLNNEQGSIFSVLAESIYRSQPLSFFISCAVYGVRPGEALSASAKRNMSIDKS